MYLIWPTFPYCYYMIWWIILQDNLLQCYNAMQDIVIDGYESVFDMVSSSVTPVNVLDQQFSSTESEKTNGTITSSSTSRSERDIKRRRIIGYCDNLTVQISRIQQCWWAWFHSINHRSIWEWHYLPQVMNRKRKVKKRGGWRSRYFMDKTTVAYLRLLARPIYSLSAKTELGAKKRIFVSFVFIRDQTKTKHNFGL